MSEVRMVPMSEAQADDAGMNEQWEEARSQREDNRRLIPWDEFASRMASIAHEVHKNASFEGRIEWSLMEGIDGEEVPAGQVAVSMFVRVGNDMGQGGVMLVQREEGE
jgi:hypothetical protein